MKKMYVAPEMEIIETKLSSLLVGSENTENGYLGTDDNQALAPTLMSFDDMDTDYMEEDDY